jgi:hypothetical protein
MSVQLEGEVVFGQGDWLQTQRGVTCGVKVRHFESNMNSQIVVIQIWEKAGSGWNFIDDVQIATTAELQARNVTDAMTKLLTKLRAWLSRRFATATAPTTGTTPASISAFAAALDAEVQKMRLVDGNPPTVLYP